MQDQVILPEIWGKEMRKIPSAFSQGRVECISSSNIENILLNGNLLTCKQARNMVIIHFSE